MVTLSKYGANYNRTIAYFKGLSTDEKPEGTFKEYDEENVFIREIVIQNGSRFTEIDTGKEFTYDRENQDWYESSSGGGTSDYSDLDNKPQINNVELDGNKSLSDLGIQGEVDSSHKLSADLIDDTSSTNKFNIQADWGQTTSSAGDYIKNKPTLGTASALDVPITGDAGNDEVVKGNDSRLSDARTPVAHNQASETINLMTGYVPESPAVTDSILATDTLNQAIKKLDQRSRSDETIVSNIKAKTDRIIMDNTETQDYYMQDSTPSNPTSGDYWFSDDPLLSSDITAMTGYAKAQTASAIVATDSLNQAVGKLEYKVDIKQNEVLGSWTAGTATTHQTPNANDTVVQALQKIDNNQRNDENDILTLQQQVGYANTELEGVL